MLEIIMKGIFSDETAYYNIFEKNYFPTAQICNLTAVSCGGHFCGRAV
jgi:hypothetical protein